MSRGLAPLPFVFCLLASACLRPESQSVDCNCGASPPATTIGFRAAQDAPAPGFAPMTLSAHGMGGTVFVSDTESVGMADVGTVAVFLLEGGKPVLSLGLTADGARKMRALSQAQMGRRLAFLVDGRLVQAGTVMAEISDAAMITGSLSMDECCAVACAFRAGRGNRTEGT